MKKLDDYLSLKKISAGHIRYMPASVKEELYKRTPKCHSNNVREKLYWLLNSLNAYPKCSYCAKELDSTYWRINANCYSNFCSQSCVAYTRQNSDSYKLNNLKKYGVEHPLSAQEIQQKRKQTNLEKYGRAHPHPWSSEEYKNNIEKKYNTPTVRHIPGVNEKIVNTIFQQSLSLLPANIESTEKQHNVKLCSDITTVEWISKKISDTPLLWQHLECNNIYQSPLGSAFRSCPRCAHGTSKLENEIIELVKMLIPEEDIVIRSKKIISPFELDIFIPSLNIAIEVDGSYWHSAKFVTEENADRKLKLCREKGIKLITIQESLFRVKPKLVEDRLRTAFNKQQHKVFARKCKIVKLDATLKNFFFNQNHLNGDARSSFTYALVYNEIVVMAMSFAKSRFNRKIKWEIIRSCSKMSTIVVGGVSRLIKYFKKMHNNESLITYADLDWGSGESYQNAGMKFSHFTKPSYCYIGSNHDRLTRYMAQKNKLLSILGPEKYDPYLTERENMTNAGYLIVYDRGNAVYTMI